ncbi:MAG: tRNA (guanine(10)-N(2))-dimethyltransferase [Candidatus Methanomethylicia archaeon]
METSFPVEEINEGKARIIIPKLNLFRGSGGTYRPSLTPVFYNPNMKFNRDLSILLANTISRMLNRDLNICEPLSGTGVRGIRYALECKARSVILNDRSSIAYQFIKRNVKLNNIEDIVQVYNEDASLLLLKLASEKLRFDIIDIDPFGSPVEFIEPALKALRNGGVLCVTATDLIPLCGIKSDACERKYLGKPLRSYYCRELALRLLINMISTKALQQNILVEPLISYAYEHYIRTHLRIFKGALKANKALNMRGIIMHCFKCDFRLVIEDIIAHKEKCPYCSGELIYSGPLWIGPIINRDFCTNMIRNNEELNLETKKKIGKFLNILLEESILPPTFYNVDHLCSKIKKKPPKIRDIIYSLQKLKYEAGPTHIDPKGFKTNAPLDVVMDVISRL